MKIWLEDIRPAPHGWRRFKNVHSLIFFYSENSKNISEMSLDHDLGKNELTGHDFLSWLEEEVYNKIYTHIPKIKIHSANPIGRKMMELALISINKGLNQ